MPHTYDHKNLSLRDNSFAYLNSDGKTKSAVDARYIASAGTLSEVVSAISGSEEAAKELPVASMIQVGVLTSGQLAMQGYLVTANTGTAITLTAEAVA